MRSLPIATAAAAAVVGSALALGQDPAQKPAAPAQAPAAKEAAPAPAPAPSEFKDLKSRASYIFGFNLYLTLKAQGVALEFDPEAVAKGVRDAQAGGKPAMSDAEIKDTLQTIQREAMAKQAEQQKAVQAKMSQVGEANQKEGAEFLAANGKKPGVVTLPSGLQYKVVKDGTGTKPKPSDMVTVHYEGKLLSGQVFDSSYRKGAPVEFPLKDLIPGWVEAMQLMKAGSEWELYIPSNLAYGPQGRPSIPPNSTLIFKIELIAVNGQK